MPTELKVVMFTDQVESTPNTVRRTSAEIAQVSLEQNELTSDVLRLTRGALLKDTGDGCLAQFPAVIDAVQAGMLLQQRVADRNAHVPQQNERLKFQLHIGIDVGELVVMDNGDLRGDAANRCARVCSECSAGEVYLSDIAAEMLKQNEVELEILDACQLDGFKGQTQMYRVRKLYVSPQSAPNPFIWRGGITAASDFFAREREQRTVHSYLHGRQNCQIVGARRIGKTSLLKQVERVATKWDETITVAYIDLQDPRCYSLAGWLGHVSKQYHWSKSVTTLVDFAECIETEVAQFLRPVLCLDEFEELTARRGEFTRDFFMTMRACSQQGLSIVTVSQRPLSELTDNRDPTSPFYNTFPLLRLGPFHLQDAEDFIDLHRPGTLAFTFEEKMAILDFAKGHPLALQVACFHVLESKQKEGSLTAALREATDDLKCHLPLGL